MIRRWTDDIGRWLMDWREKRWDSLAWSGAANVAAICALYLLWTFAVWLALLGLNLAGMMPSS